MLVEAVVVVHRHDEAKKELLIATKLNRSFFIVIGVFLGMLFITVLIALIVVRDTCWCYCLKVRFCSQTRTVIKFFASTATTMTEMHTDR